MTQTRNEAALRLWFRILRLQSRMTAAIDKRLKELGLSIPQSDVLATLTEGEGVTQQELAGQLYVTKGNISGLIDRLVAAGYVERRAAETDRRSHAVYLTPTGRRLAQLSIQVQEQFVAETLGRLSAQHISELETILLAARDLVRAQNSNPRRASDRTRARMRRAPAVPTG